MDTGRRLDYTQKWQLFQALTSAQACYESFPTENHSDLESLARAKAELRGLFEKYVIQNYPHKTQEEYK